jgi:anti-sigma B factor antagonist
MSSDIKVVQPLGILDSVCGNQLRRDVADSLESKQVNILVDCQGIDFMDSSGLSCLIMTLKNVRSAGGNLALSNINGQIRLLLELTAMEGVIKVYEGVEDFSQGIFSLN